MTLPYSLRNAPAFLIPALMFILPLSCTFPGNNNDGELQVLQGAILIDGTGEEPVENSVLIIEDQKITCAGTEEECPIPRNADVTDVSGAFITPGLVDAHVHFFQTAFFDSRPDALDLRDTYPFTDVAAFQKQHPQRYYNAYLCSGITAVYDVGGFAWSVDLQKSAETNPQAPHVAAAGPLLTPSTLDLLNTPFDKVLVNLDSKETGVKSAQFLSELGSTGVKLWQLKPEDEEFMGIIRAVVAEANRTDNSLIVHATTLSQAKSALNVGAHLLVHSVEDTAVDEEFIAMAKDQGTIYTPTLIVGSGYMMAYRAASGISPFPIEDPNGCVDAKTTALLEKASQFEDHPAFTEAFRSRLQSFNPVTDRVSRISMQNLKRVYEAGIPIAVGTDAGNPGTLHGLSIFEELEAMQSAGIPPGELIVMATRNGAMAMEREKDFGTIELGKFANLLLLEKDPTEDIANMRSLRKVMIKGRMTEVNKLQPNE